MHRFTSSTAHCLRGRWLVSCLLIGGVLAGIWTLLAPWAASGHVAEPTARTKPGDRQVTLAVTHLIQQEHLSRRSLDDEISKRGLDHYLKSLDPMKMYFYQSDIDEFMRHRLDLDDAIKRGDISFAHVVRGRFLQRIDERLQVIDELLDSRNQFDFTDDEEIVTDSDLLRHPRTPQEARQRWRKRIKYDLLVLKGAKGKDKLEGEAAREKLSRRYHSFVKRMKHLNGDDVLESYLTAVTSSFDPHTTYMSPSTLQNFQIMMGLKLEGIGAALQSTDGNTVVSKIIPKGAADKHGKLKAEDRIISVGQGDQGEMEDVVDMNLNEVVKRIRGRAGTVVRLGVIPQGSNEMRIYRITRAKIELKDEEARAEVVEEGKKRSGAPYRVGYIDLPSFYMDMEGARKGLAGYKSTSRDVRRILDNFGSQGVDVVVLDLRHNGGGSLTEAIKLTGLFIDRGPVVQVKDSGGRVHHYDDLDRGMAWKGPLVVLTSKFSASASEILAGAIQDYNRGLVVGDESTHGKGTVQSLLNLGQQLFGGLRPQFQPNLGALKITMQQFYRPNGDSTQKRGVLSDVVLPSFTNHMDIGEADLDWAIDFDRAPPARYARYSMLPPQVLRSLRERSLGRQRGSEDFQKLRRNIERYKEQKERKTISVNEEKFFARRAEFDADEEDKKQIEEQLNNKDDAGLKKGAVLKRNFYMDEVLAITVDYLNLLDPQKVARAQ